jgi:hypothetical protein
VLVLSPGLENTPFKQPGKGQVGLASCWLLFYSSTLKMEVVSSETSVNLYGTIRHHISESSVLLVLCTFVGAGSAVSLLSADKRVVSLRASCLRFSHTREQFLYRRYERFVRALQD